MDYQDRRTQRRFFYSKVLSSLFKKRSWNSTRLMQNPSGEKDPSTLDWGYWSAEERRIEYWGVLNSILAWHHTKFTSRLYAYCTRYANYAKNVRFARTVLSTFLLTMHCSRWLSMFMETIPPAICSFFCFSLINLFSLGCQKLLKVLLI